mgnify:CR=1 FL=1
MKSRLPVAALASLTLLLLMVLPALAHSELPDQNSLALQQATSIPSPTAVSKVRTNQEWSPVEQDFDGVTMVVVPAGCFRMGSTESQIDHAIELANRVYPSGAQRKWFADEKPVHEICFDQPFWIDRTEVTQAQFRQFGGKTSFFAYFTGDSLPRECITWFEARDFCALRGARLPTEAEWEYAARGPDSLIYPWGNKFMADNVVYGGKSTKQTAPVGSRPDGISWVGALDMSGNVREWTTTIYQPYPYKADDGRESTADMNSSRVERGGSWLDAEYNVRATDRFKEPPDYRNGDLGFRCARSYE